MLGSGKSTASGPREPRRKGAEKAADPIKRLGKETCTLSNSFLLLQSYDNALNVWTSLEFSVFPTAASPPDITGVHLSECEWIGIVIALNNVFIYFRRELGRYLLYLRNTKILLSWCWVIMTLL